MDATQFEKYNIPSEKFAFANKSDMLHDQKFDTKPVGYFRDAFRRFCKNKASVIAACIIIFLLVFSVLGSALSPFNVDFRDTTVSYRLPKWSAFEWLGWDGCKNNDSVNGVDYYRYLAIEAETGEKVVRKTYNSYYVETQIATLIIKQPFFGAKIDSYTKDLVQFVYLTDEDYQALQQYQDENNLQIIYPAIPELETGDTNQYNANVWYKTYTSGVNKGLPIGYVDEDTAFEFENNYIAYDGKDGYTSSVRIEGETPLYNYAIRKSNQWKLRVNYNLYFTYVNGVSPEFIFGSNQFGQDILACIANGARFSLLFAVCISAINLFIGAIYGAIEGYFGGAVDITMERISDILSGVPFTVVVMLFREHLMSKIGTLPMLLLAFVMTGWIGMASNTRMQFYRYKNQEYVLAAKTLGASNARIMFKHIFPNALGTLITSCVLVIPSVIFSESSLSYLGIVNLSTGNRTSIGTLLAGGNNYVSTYPHIVLFPALFIALLMISFNLFGNGLRDAFNPSLRGVEE